jgi:hypothetical protein
MLGNHRDDLILGQLAIVIAIWGFHFAPFQYLNISNFSILLPRQYWADLTDNYHEIYMDNPKNKISTFSPNDFYQDYKGYS